MKNLILLLALCTSTMMFSQFTNNDRNQVNNIRFGLWNKCTQEWLEPPSRRSAVDAYEDLEIWNRNGNNEDRCWEIEADGSGRINYTKRWLASNTQALLEKFTKDTIVKYGVFNMILCDADTLRYGFDKKDDFISLPVVDSFPRQKRMYWINTRVYYDKYGDTSYETNKEAYGYQPTRYVHDSIRRQDSVYLSTQYFYTKMWDVARREHNNLDSLKAMPFGEFGYTPGSTVINGIPVRRHTLTTSKKYVQIIARDTITKTVDTLSIRVNNLKKL